ncbi:hypothetical protein [Nocardioides lijunqiniae]|uniref:hypothetical protein n=1 Tax=Nocardioides lijunqiniae TaxID=2760832 RepID=UPI00187896E6|nr:hypothetical protein [Nocardioides lijunqiniae]
MSQHDHRPHESDRDDLEEALRRLAASVDPPSVPASADLARGRRRRRRHRLAVSAGVVAAVAAIGVGTAVVDGKSSADGDTRPPVATTSPTPEVREIRPTPGPPGGAAAPGALDAADAMKEIRTDPDLNRYRDVLAEYLDPEGEHLEKGVSNRQSGGMSQGTKLAWTNDGESGMGMVQVTVSAGWGGVDVWDCGAGWTCRDIPAGRGLTAEVAEHDGVTEVAVEHDDGIVVVIAVDALFGNNSTVPVSGIDLGDDLLARAAADPRLDLPAYAAGIPPALDQRTFARVGQRLLAVGTDELETTYAGTDAQPWVEADWSDGVARGRLTWDAAQSGQLQGEAYACMEVQYLRCEMHRVGDREVFVGYARAKWGGGWRALYAGPSYTLTVSFEPTGGGDLPPERAFAFVTDPRWQPAR